MLREIIEARLQALARERDVHATSLHVCAANPSRAGCMSATAFATLAYHRNFPVASSYKYRHRSHLPISTTWCRRCQWRSRPLQRPGQPLQCVLAWPVLTPLQVLDVLYAHPGLCGLPAG
jgi:hypothetical protein